MNDITCYSMPVTERELDAINRALNLLLKDHANTRLAFRLDLAKNPDDKELLELLDKLAGDVELVHGILARTAGRAEPIFLTDPPEPLYVEYFAERGVVWATDESGGETMTMRCPDQPTAEAMARELNEKLNR